MFVMHTLLKLGTRPYFSSVGVHGTASLSYNSTQRVGLVCDILISFLFLPLTIVVFSSPSS